jgi:hypothetical protein
MRPKPILAAALMCATLGSRVEAATGPLPETYVLIIANNRSLDPGVSPLRFADDDGARYYELFRLTTFHLAFFSVLDDETADLFPRAAEVAQVPEEEAILKTLDKWNREMEKEAAQGRESELYIIYAGHGDMDETGEGYINLQRTKLKRKDLYQKILSPAKATFVHLIIDACKSYFLVKRRGKDAWKDDGAAD